MLALLASACFPVAVQAETVYNPESPTIPNEDVRDPGKPTNNGSDESSEDAEISDAPGGTGSGSDGGSGAGTGAGGGDGEGTGQGTQGDGSQGNQAGELGGGKPLNTADSTAASEDSSSPLVPILIAIAVLAAISIGAVVIKQRQQRRGSGSVSPKAG